MKTDADVTPTRSGGFRMSKDRAEAMGLWVMRRFTVSRCCDRYTQTNRERFCARCWNKADKLLGLLRWR